MASAYLLSLDTTLTNLDAASFSVAFWLRPTAGPTYTSVILVEGPAFKATLDSGGTVTFTIKDSVTTVETSVQSSNTVVPSDWNHVVIVYDKSTTSINIYLNSIATSASYGSNPADSSLSQYVPGFQFSNSSRFGAPDETNFDIDSATAWARALSAAEVLALFNSSVGIDYPFMGGPFNLIFQANLSNDVEPTPLVLGSGFQLWDAERSFDSTNQVFQITANLLFSGSQVTQGFNWTADNFADKVLFAQHDNVCQYWTPPFPNLALPIPGLPTEDDMWDGVTVFFNHAMLWKGDRLKWSDVDDFTTWIPVAVTAVSAVLTTESPFVQPAVGGTVTVTVSDPQAAVVSISLSGSLAFPSTAVGSTSQAILTISNTGTTSLTVTGVSFPDGFSGDFVGPVTIPVNQSIPVVVTFAPTNAISYDGVVTAASNATTGTSSIPISGTGTGTTKVIELSGNLAFGTNVLNRAVTSALVITNNGNATLNVSSITLPTGFTGSFSGTVAAGASQDVLITFTPTAKQLYAGNITVNSDATAGASLIAVSGTGVSAQPYAIFLTDKGTCQFGNVPTGSTPTGTLTIYNTGNQPFNVLGITLPTGFTGSFTGTIAAHSSHNVTITFSPISAIPYGGTVTVSTNRPTIVGSTTMSVSGTGTTAGKVLALSGDLSFGDVPVNSTVENILTIKNVGTVATTVSSISYPSGFSGAYSGTIAPGQSKNILVTFSPTAAISYGGNLTVTSDDIAGTDTFPVSGTGTPLPVPSTLQPGQFVSLPFTSNGVTTYNFYTVISMAGTSLVLQLLDLTGVTPAGTTIGVGNQIFTVDANEAGETRVIGSDRNGPIFRILTQGDYAYIFKERSIQSIQFVGITSGTFLIHPEVSGEGLIGRNALVNLNDGRMVFLGHKELYQYAGGPTPQPACQQYTRQLFAELDRTRLYQILLYHNEIKHEVWVSYPVTGGGFKVLIWNYVEDTAAIDDYDPSVLFTAINFADWTADPTWQQLADSTSWLSFDSSVAWQDLVGASSDHLTLLASMDGNLRIWGTRFAREGAGYLSVSETMDFDLGEWDMWKYVDAVVLGLQVRSFESTPRLLYVQVGGSVSVDDSSNENDITWTAPQSVLVNGNAVTPIKVNPGGAGRYLRVRFYSQDPDVQWRISSFEILARPGGFY